MRLRFICLDCKWTVNDSVLKGTILDVSFFKFPTTALCFRGGAYNPDTFLGLDKNTVTVLCCLKLQRRAAEGFTLT